MVTTGTMGKSLIGGIQKFSTEDGPGIRTTIFFKGCPIHCKWCHNPDLIHYGPELRYTANKCIGCGACGAVCPNDAVTYEEGKARIDRSRCRNCGICAETCYTDALKITGCEMNLPELMETILQDRSFYRETGGGVTLSGGEITTHPEAARSLLEACNQKEIGVALDTCGYCAYDTLESLARRAEYVLYDLKCIDSATHEECTGVRNERILENLKKLAENPALKEKVIIRMPLIHPVNDSLDYMERTATFLQELGFTKVNGIPYHSMGLSKSRSLGQEGVEFQTPSPEHLGKIKQIFVQKNLDFTVMGEEG